MCCGFAAAERVCRDGGNASVRGPAPPLGIPGFPGLQRTGDRFGSRSRFRPLRQSGIPSQRIKKASTFDILGVAGRRYVVLSALTETALVRKPKHPKGLRCHYTFRIGAVFVEFLKRMMHNAQRPIFLILDGGSFHHSLGLPPGLTQTVKTLFAVR